MAVRLYSEFKSDTGQLFKVEIHDTDFTGTASTFNVAGDGFTLKYEGGIDNIVAPVVGSECQISAFNTTSAFDLFITDLKAHQEDRFFVRILKDVAENLYWTGVIVQDLITIEDVSKPYIFQISAVDGIGHLKNKEYTSTAVTTINEFIEGSVNAIGLADLYDTLDIYYATTINVWDSAHIYSISEDVTTLTRFNALVYKNVDNDGTPIYSTYFDILVELCTSFGARFYQANGIFHFEQYAERVNAERRVAKYYKTGVEESIALVDDDVTLAGTVVGGVRLAGNQFNFLPALKKVQVSFNQERMNNLLANRLTFTGSTAAQDLGFVTDENNAQLQVSGLLTYRFDYDGSGATASTEFYRPVFRVQLKVEDVSNPGTFYYLKRDWTPSGGQLYGATSWTTTASYYYVDAGMGKNNNDGLYISNTFAFITPAIPVDGDASIDVDFYNIFDLSNATQTVPTNYIATNRATEVTVSYIDEDGGVSNVTIFSSTNTDTDINSNLILDLGQIRVSDSNGLQGSFFVYNGSSWVPSTSWRRGASGTYQSLLKMTTKDILSLHKKPIQRYSGVIAGPFTFNKRYEFDGSYWLPIRGEYNANLDEWSSDWFKIEQTTTGIDIDVPSDDGDYGTASFRVSGQSGTDEVFVGTDVITDNVDAAGTLDVAGDTTLQNLDHQGTLIEEITDVTNSAGSRYDVGDTEYMIFNRWSGGNGTATINLPRAGDNEGRLLRFKSDGTIGANTAITLSPSSPDTIDGDAEFSFNRDYDGVMLLAHNSNWYIIQRKAK